MGIMILIIDNGMYANSIRSFVSYSDHKTKVINSYNLTLDKVEKLNPKGIIISNGLVSDKIFEYLQNVVERFSWRAPILGIGIGSLVISTLYGSKVKINELENYKPHKIICDRRTIFKNINEEIIVSFINYYNISKENFPKKILEVSATTKNRREILAFRHKNLAIEGINFHMGAETLNLSKNIIKNFINSYYQ